MNSSTLVQEEEEFMRVENFTARGDALALFFCTLNLTQGHIFLLIYIRFKIIKCKETEIL